jgi:hypothetical protein
LLEELEKKNQGKKEMHEYQLLYSIQK